MSVKRWMRTIGRSAIGTAWLVATCAVGVKSNAAVQPVGPADARWTDGFWAERVDVCRTQTLPALWRILEGTNYSHFLQNFKIATGETEGRYRGAPFNDGEVYKVLEASAALLAITNDAALSEKVDATIDLIARAQRSDGYIHTPALVKARQGDTNAVPFQDRHNFEMYNMGHLMTAAALHHRVTGKTNLLIVARQAADFLQRTFEHSSPEAARSSVCPSHYMGIVDLYRVTAEPQYLSLAQRFFELRSQITDGGDDNQDRIPFSQQTDAVGHAVRANYLYAGAADLFLETGNTNFWNPLEPIWENVVGKKMYITGGCGALFDGASPEGSKDQRSITRTHQAYGRNYQLPNTTAHNETCANIGNVLWNWRMFLATGRADYVDVAELAFYNSVLSGMDLGGTNFFYVNPLRTTDPLPTELRWQHQRVPFLGSFCCPPNLARTLMQSARYAYARSDRAVWVNLYGGSELAATIPGAGPVTLRQTTAYPWNGRVRIAIEQCSGAEFSLKLRIPKWTRGVQVRVNQSIATADVEAVPGSYLDLRRAWKNGDVIDLDLTMPVQVFEANPLVEETLGQVAFKRGPIVYCLESADLPQGTTPLEIAVQPGSEWLARFDQRAFGGVVVLEGTGVQRPRGTWQGTLYREWQSAPVKPIRVRLIPYALWANRGRSEMSVWLPASNPQPAFHR
jgi:DUF1680 family protein